MGNERAAPYRLRREVADDDTSSRPSLSLSAKVGQERPKSNLGARAVLRPLPLVGVHSVSGGEEGWSEIHSHGKREANPIGPRYDVSYC